MSLPPLVSKEAVQVRLEQIFPETFPDRKILVKTMCAKLIAAALYGGFVTGKGRYFRPSMMTNFSDEQFALGSDEERERWATTSFKPKFRAIGTPWYANNTRETLRDDLMRNRLIPLGILQKLEGKAPNYTGPTYSINRSFLDLFDPTLAASDLETRIKAWQAANLNPATLRRMALLATGVKAKEGSIEVTLPTTGRALRLTAGMASLITKDVCEVFAPAFVSEPVVIHVSLSDQKIFPELAGEAKAVGLSLDTALELPDVIFVDVGRDPMLLVFVEVVYSDGPINELRAAALMKIAKTMGFEPDHVALVTAFEDRSADALRRRFSELAVGSLVWFRSEPDMFLHLGTLRRPGD